MLGNETSSQLIRITTSGINSQNRLNPVHFAKHLYGGITNYE